MLRALFLLSCLGAALLSGSPPASADPPDQPATRPATRPVDAKVTAAREVYERVMELRQLGVGREQGYGYELLYNWSRRWMEAEREAAANPDGRRAAVAAHRDRMKTLAERAEMLHLHAPVGQVPYAGRRNFVDVAATRYYVAEAEQWVEESSKN